MTKIPTEIPWWRPEVGEEEKAAVLKVLDSQYLNEGEVTARFESRLCELTGAKHAIAVTSGTAALYLSLKALHVGPGDEVLVPDLTFIATANAVTMTGAKPVLIDVDPQTLTMDPEQFKKNINSRSKAVIPVHVSGRAAPLTAILKIAAAAGIAVVEDAAEAFLGEMDGKCLGTFGSAGCFSFSPHKSISTGQGGAILTHSDDLHQRLLELKDQGRPKRGTGGDDLHPRVGFNFKFTNLQAAVGLAQLDRVQYRIQRLKQIYQLYEKELQGVSGISLWGFALKRGEYPQWVDARVEKRDALDQYLLAQKIHCRRFWFPLHNQEPYRRSDKDFPVTSLLAPQCLWLPSSFSLKDEDIRRVCLAIKAFF